MKSIYKYIHFIKHDLEEQTKQSYACINNKSVAVLGYVTWYKTWKQYVFTQADHGIIFNSGCQRDIADFMDNLLQETK